MSPDDTDTSGGDRGATGSHPAKAWAGESGAGRPPHPATVAQRSAPHPATVAQRSAPHPATVALNKAAPEAAGAMLAAPPGRVPPSAVAQRSYYSRDDLEMVGGSIGRSIREYFDGFWELTGTNRYVWHYGTPDPERFESANQTRRDWFGVSHSVFRARTIKPKPEPKTKPRPKPRIETKQPIHEEKKLDETIKLIAPPRRKPTYSIDVPADEDELVVDELRRLATDCKQRCKVRTEVQIMRAFGMDYVAANTPTDAALLDPLSLGDIYGVSPKRIVVANSLEVALNKSGVLVVVYLGQGNQTLHAEQRLLEILAMKLREGVVPQEKVYVAGYNCPCKVCLPVVQRFTAAMLEAYGVRLIYDPRPRENVKQHGGGGGQLSLTSVKTDSHEYRRFVQVYNEE